MQNKKKGIQKKPKVKNQSHHHGKKKGNQQDKFSKNGTCFFYNRTC